MIAKYLFLLSTASVVVSWSPNSESDLSGYKVYYGLSPRFYTEIVDAGMDTSLKISGLQTGLQYFFAVTAYDFAGNESEFSEEVSLTLQARPAWPDLEIVNVEFDSTTGDTAIITDRLPLRITLRYFDEDSLTLDRIDSVGIHVRNLAGGTNWFTILTHSLDSTSVQRIQLAASSYKICATQWSNGRESLCSPFRLLRLEKWALKEEILLLIIPVQGK